MNNSIKNLCIFFLLSIQFSAFSQDLKPGTYSVKFKLKMMGLGVNGTLSNLKTKVQYAPTGELQSINASVETKTVNTNNSLRDKHLVEKEEFFEPEKYPTINLVSKSITKNGRDYVGTFVLTLKNVSKTIKVPIEVEYIKDSSQILKANFAISRKEYQFGGSTLGMGDTIDIALRLQMK
jgi:polyisoprenoid-binding protein YceI